MDGWDAALNRQVAARRGGRPGFPGQRVSAGQPELPGCTRTHQHARNRFTNIVKSDRAWLHFRTEVQ